MNLLNHLFSKHADQTTVTPAILNSKNCRARFLAAVQFVLVLILSAVNPVFAGGGPDAYGYTWLQTGDPGAPAFSWIDITGVGTEVVGLADDNAVGPINMGMTFHYYWGDYSEITIGSNGWLSFDSVGNIAHCFPAIPTAGGPGENFVAPFMADLNFTGAGNPAQVFSYSDVANDRFIVSFHQVPFWANSAQGWVGSNTFQIIFSTTDNSIVFQYLDMDASFNDIGGCTQDVSGGIENVTGNIGLQVFVEQMPPDSHVIALTYPEVVTFEIIDPAPLWHNDVNNKGVFRAANQDIPLEGAIWNAGNTDTSVSVSVQGQIQDLALAVVSDETLAVPGVLAQQVAAVNFSAVAPPVAGEYYFTTNTTSPEDINPSNNDLRSEIQVVDTTQATLDLGYTAVSVPSGLMAWSGGDGGGAIYIRPPVPDYRVDSVSMWVEDDGIDATSAYQVLILDDNGPGLSPGTVLVSQTMEVGTFTPGTWVETTLDTPVTVRNGGVFVAWISNGPNIFLGTDSSGPISRHSWEKIGSDDWAEYRAAATADPMMRAIVTPLAPEVPLFADGFESGMTDFWSSEFP